MSKRREGLPSVGAATRTAIRSAYWFGAEQDLVEQGYLKDAGQTFVIVQPLPPKNDFEAELRAKWTHTIDAWMEAVKVEIGDIVSDLDGLQTDDSDTSEIIEEAKRHLNYIMETFPFDDTHHLGWLTVHVPPKDLVVTCKHRRSKPRDDARAQVSEVCAILRACAAVVRKDESGDDADMFVSNLGDLQRSLKQVVFPEVENIE